MKRVKNSIVKKKIVFLTGTRADFGKMKSIIGSLHRAGNFEVHIFATGMHMLSKYGYTVNEIEKEKLPHIYKFINQIENASLDQILANTLQGFGNYIQELKPDMIVVHGDRVEALAGALVGSFNNILVAHIEGGEVSGTIDEHIRHAISKVSHLHFVSNKTAQRRLVQMGEKPEDIFVIGSPDIDIMNSCKLPSLQSAQKRYGLKFDKYAILIQHPVTTEMNLLPENVSTLIKTLKESDMNYLVIHPNNDPGTDIIQDLYKSEFSGSSRFKIFPSIRFEYFLTLLKNSHFIIGNSSVGIREAPYYGVPSIDTGTRQTNRAKGLESVHHCDYDQKKMMELTQKFGNKCTRFKQSKVFGDGKSDQKMLSILKKGEIFKRNIQKQFRDIEFL